MPVPVHDLDRTEYADEQRPVRLVDLGDVFRLHRSVRVPQHLLDLLELPSSHPDRHELEPQWFEDPPAVVGVEAPRRPGRVRRDDHRQPALPPTGRAGDIGRDLVGDAGRGEHDRRLPDLAASVSRSQQERRLPRRTGRAEQRDRELEGLINSIGMVRMAVVEERRRIDADPDHVGHLGEQ
jgi:hypothetical protein